jgi:hypothetical protein
MSWCLRTAIIRAMGELDGLYRSNPVSTSVWIQPELVRQNQGDSLAPRLRINQQGEVKSPLIYARNSPNCFDDEHSACPSAAAASLGSSISSSRAISR